MTFKLFPGRKEPLHDLESGHVAIELTKKGQQPPQVPQEVMDICVAGDEVTLANPTLRAELTGLNRSNGIHSVSWQDMREQETVNETEDSSVSSDELSVAEVMKADALPDRNRMRAAPFYNELMPGWRARARELAPPYRKRDAVLGPRERPADVPTLDSDGMESVQDKGAAGGSTYAPHGMQLRRRRQGPVHLANAKGRARGAGKNGIGNDSSAGRERVSDDAARTSSSEQGNEQGSGGPSLSDPERSGEDEASGWQLENSRCQKGPHEQQSYC